MRGRTFESVDKVLGEKYSTFLLRGLKCRTKLLKGVHQGGNLCGFGHLLDDDEDVAQKRSRSAHQGNIHRLRT